LTAAWLDHVGFVAPRLDALRATFVRLGFAPTEPAALQAVDASGRTVALGQSSAHVVFERGYLELSEVHTRDPSHHLAHYASRYDGAHILALATADAAAARAAAVAGCVDVGPLQTATRRVDYGAAPGDARFSWFMASASASPEALVCVVEHLTPERIFQPEVQRHPNGARALTRVCVVAAAAADLDRRFGALGKPSGDGSVEVLTPAQAKERWPGMRLPPAPCIAALRIEVADLVAARSACVCGGVPVHASSAASFRVAPEHGGGAVLEFGER
jgi:hypothetical protein